MKVEQLYTSCLSEMAYYICSNGEAAIIDPLRETEPYIRLAEADGVKIKYVFLTHFHADFVSGHVDLANKTGANIVYGPNAETDFDFHKGQDGELFKIGDVSLKLLHTPGHTMESSSYLLIDKNGSKPYVFTGDCLFIGDVGRPDLAVKSDLSENDLAGLLYDSLRNKIMPLPDDIIVYPAHGAGSACGKNMSKETFDTLGHQKATNYALRADMTKKEFINEVITGLVHPPQYFPKNVQMNKSVNAKIDDIIHRGTTPLDVNTFKALSQQGDVLVIDTRSKQSYTDDGTIPGAWYIGVDGNFAPWVGTLIIDINQKIIFIADDELRVNEIVTRFSRVGYDNTLGYLAGGFTAWREAGFAVDKINSETAANFAKKFKDGTIPDAIDVRRDSEYLSQHVEGLTNFPLDTIHQNIEKLDPNKNYHLHCASGYRSLITASILQAHGIKNVTDIRGGFNDLKETDLVLTNYVCPTTLL
ncbi:MAG: MBL fold metallo-hydrolase [Flavobacteriales bacterium]|nr:MBL fold metallo-hydrolase [Flavobacteriales bacterium]